jgi:hypothetical protein
VFRRASVHLEPDRRGFLAYVAFYQVLTSLASLRGYAQFAFGSNRRWK